MVPVGLLKTNSMCIKAWTKLCLLYLYSFLISVLILSQTHAKPMEVLIILCVPCICACLVCMFMEETWDHCKAPWPKQDEMDETYLKTKFKTMGFVFIMECLCWPTISCIIIFFFLVIFVFWVKFFFCLAWVKEKNEIVGIAFFW